ncbi:MAG: hypothetical protein ACOVN9_06965, partial [Inhella sp.]
MAVPLPQRAQKIGRKRPIQVGDALTLVRRLARIAQSIGPIDPMGLQAIFFNEPDGLHQGRFDLFWRQSWVGPDGLRRQNGQPCCGQHAQGNQQPTRPPCRQL